MSAISEEHCTDTSNPVEPLKKKFKTQVTAVDLCKVVIENSSSEEENSGKIVDTTSSDGEEAHTDSSYDSDDEPIEDGTDTYWFEKNPKEDEKIYYREAVGLKALPLGSQPRDFFNLLMNKSIYNLIIKNTNAYVSKVTNNTKNPKTSSWKPLKEDELQKFLGLLFLMGVIHLPDLCLYWSDDILFNFPSFRQIMSMERFVSIFHCLHFSDDSIPDSADPLKKVRPLMDFFNMLMESIYIPQKELVLNDPISIAERPKSGRVKVFTLCEPHGMVLKYLVHRRTKKEQANPYRKHNIAKELLEDKLGKGHSVYLGEYFTSIPLIDSLKEENTYATGALSQTNRKCCEELLATFSEKNYFCRFTGEGVCLLKWKEKRKETVCISSKFDGLLPKVIDRHKSKSKPLAIIELETFLLAENSWFEQPKVSFQKGNKKLKWYQRVGFQIISIIMMNSYHLYSRSPQSKTMSLLNFKLNLIKTLLYSSNDPEDALLPQSSEGFVKPHVLDYVGRNEKGFRKRKRCKYCITEKGVRVDSYYHCITCENQPGFCLGQCFIKYHKYDSPQ